MSSVTSPTASLLTFVKGRKGDQQTALICLQHLLPSIEYLFQRIILSTKIPPCRIFVIGKPYSTITSVVDRLKQLGINVFVPDTEEFEPGNYAEDYERIIRKYWAYVLAHPQFDCAQTVVLDEGGNLRRAMPAGLARSRRIVAIEHTSSGVMRGEGAPVLDYPLILLARSFAKTRFESPYIAKAIVERLDISLCDAEGSLSDGVRPLARKRVGIIGLGHLGATIARELKMIAGVASVHAADANEQVFSDPVNRWVPHLSKSEVVQQSDVILGCTGSELVDIDVPLFGTPNLVARGNRSVARSNKSVPRKYFGSCSSGDREFQSLIRRLRVIKSAGTRRSIFADSRGQVGECDVTLMNGGFPLNFNRADEFEPFERIRLTRELTLTAVMQATFMLDCSGIADGEYKLSPQAQMLLVGRWVDELRRAHLMENLDGPGMWNALGIPFDPPYLVDQWIRASEGMVFDDNAFSSWFA